MRNIRSRADEGLPALEADELDLARALDGVFREWADRVCAIERRYGPLIEAAELDRFEYFDNFPHLGLAVAPLDTSRIADWRGAAGEKIEALPTEVMQPPRYLLPSAACYAVYLNMADSSVPAGGVVHTVAAQCFRNEEAYVGLARLLGFTMREVVFIGEDALSKDHLENFVAIVRALCEQLNLPMRIETATDPFFDKSGARARMQQLFPVKREFIVDGIAVGSVNYHRNFFGERCRIKLPEGEFAHTSCAAFGVERWVHVLSRHFGDAESAACEVRRCLAQR